MKCYLLSILVLLSSYHNCLSFAQNIQPGGDHDVDQRNITNKTKLTDLNHDVLYFIFQHFGFNDLFRITEAVPQFTYVAGRVFGKLNRDKGLYIQNRKKSRHISSDSPKHGIEVNFEVAMITFENFGDSLHRLEIDDRRLYVNESEAIYKIVNERASESLNYFHLTSVKKNTLSQFTKPFSAVEELDCFLSRKQNGTIMPFDELFPKLKYFRLIIDSETDCSIFNKRHPNLEHLSIENTEMQYGWKNSESIEGILRKNPQITSIYLKGFPDDYIKTVNNLLPNLVTLLLHSLYLNEPVHVRNVKHFLLWDKRRGMNIDKLTFSQLETLRVDSCLYYSNEWTIFFRNHPNITSLNVHVHTISETALFAELPNLADLKIYFQAECRTIDYIREIIDQNKRLTRLVMINVSYAPKLQMEFGHKWRISMIQNPRNIVMERLV